MNKRFHKLFLKKIILTASLIKILSKVKRNTSDVNKGKCRRDEEKIKVAVLGWLERKEMRGKEVNERRREERCK